MNRPLMLHTNSEPDEPGQILIVEDHYIAGEALAELLRSFGHEVEVISSGRLALDIARQHPPDLVMLDVNLPDIDGYQVCSGLKQSSVTWDVPVIMITADGQRMGQLRSIEVQADAYLSKPPDPAELEARVRMLLRAKRRSTELERAEDVIFALARTVEAKDSYTEGHLQRLTTYAVAIGVRLGLYGRDLLALRYGALLHDVGKVGIDEAIIRKRGPLTDDEYAQMRQHPIIGERIVQPLRLGAIVGPIVRHHHERWAGGGYPDGLVGEAIPLGARIVAVADAFDAMTTQRPYNQTLSITEAAERLKEGAGIFWEPAVVKAFLQWLALDQGQKQRYVG